MIRLVLSDIDGTLLPFHQWYIDDPTKNAIAGLESAGIRFGPASGRPVADIDKAFNGPGYSDTCIASDGLVALLDGNSVVDKHLPNDQLQNIADMMPCQDSIALAVAYNEDDDPKRFMTWAVISISEQAWVMLQPHIKYGDRPLLTDSVPEHNIYVAGMFGPMDDSRKDAVEAIVADKTDDLHTLRTAPGYYDVCLTSWDKASGAEALINAMGISQEEVVFLGDSDNDLALFEYFENTFCVEGGSVKAKAAARWIIPDPQDGGAISVMHALAKCKGSLSATLAELGL